MRGVLSGIVFAAALTAQAAQNLTVVYTGRTLGYARACREEVLRPQPQRPENTYVLRSPLIQVRMRVRSFPVKLYTRECVPWNDAEAYPNLLRAKIDEARMGAARVLTLGTGDHFALDYRARTVLLDEGKGGSLVAVSKDELHYLRCPAGWIRLADFDNREQFKAVIEDSAGGDSEIDGDSVAQFLVDAGYDALVPGEHDFYFGPERLRQFERLLGKSKVRMLGANLVIRGQALDPEPSRDDLVRRRDYAQSHKSIAIQLPAVVLPWWRRVRVTFADGASFESLQLCKVEKPEDIDKGCPQAGIVLKERTEKGIYEMPPEQPALDAGSVHHLCAINPVPEVDKAGDKKFKNHYCVLVRVEQPFFNGSALPYHPVPEKDAVVFGVVAAGLEKRVGKLNTIWRQALDQKGDAEHEIRVEAVDPLVAAAQVLDYCRAKGDCPDSRTRILLAQMPAAAAYGLQRALGETSRFGLVITEASAAQFTPFPRVEYPAGYPPLVVSPRMPYVLGVDGKLSVHAQRVELRCEACGGAVSEGLFRQEPLELAATPTDLVRCAVERALTDLGPAPDPQSIDASFRNLLLETMRKEARASIALVQKRDLFELKRRLEKSPEGVTSPKDRLRAAVEGIVWKGDFLLTRLVKGSALKQIMARSKEYDKLDSDIYQERSESRLGLHALGIFEDPESKKWVVDGAPVEDEKPYKVALTDYLAFGDTGYPELATPLIGAEQRPAELERSERISELVYRKLEAAHQGQNAAQPGQREFWSYFDYLKWTPPVQAPKASYLRRMADYFQLAARRTPKLPGVEGKTVDPNAETMAQVRTRWRLVNEKNEFSLALNRNNQEGQSVLLKRFQGVPESRVATAESSTWGSTWAIELRREKRRSTDFLRTESKFQRQEILNKEDRQARTYPQNEFSLEGGWRYSFTPVIHQKRWIGLLISGLLSTQFHHPLQEAAYKFPKPAGAEKCPDGSKEVSGECSTAFDAQIGRTWRYQLKAGLRRETRDSWGEAGLFTGYVRRAVDYTFQGTACSLLTNLLSDCLGKLRTEELLAGAPMQSSAMGRGPETGAFLNFNWRIPLRPDASVQLVLENRGRVYFNNRKHYLQDTRFNNLFSAGLAFPIAGKLALKPTWSLFRYVNKAGYQDPVKWPSFGLTSHAVEMKLEYRFDWLQGQPWGKVLRYGGGTK